MIEKLNIYWIRDDIIGIIVNVLRCGGRTMFMWDSVFLFRSGTLKYLQVKCNVICNLLSSDLGKKEKYVYTHTHIFIDKPDMEEYK